MITCLFCRESTEDGHDPQHCLELINEADELETLPQTIPPTWYHEVLEELT